MIKVNPVRRYIETNSINVGVLISAIILFIAMSIFFPMFLTIDNLKVMGMGFVQEAIMALGMTIVIISYGIDLSVAAILPFSAIIVGLLLKAQVAIPMAMIITLAIVAGIGYGNATMINKLKVHPMIATLAMMTILKGVNLVITQGGTISGFPDAFFFLGQGEVLGIPFPLIVFAALAVVIGYLLKHHRYFQQVYFIGGNPRAARLSGINNEAFIGVIYMLNAVLAGLAGIITASQFSAATVAFGQNAELRVFTAVFVGGASTLGGKGSVMGTFFGILFLAIISNAFVLAGAPAYWQDIVNGGMLLIAVFLDGYFQVKRKTASELKISIYGGGEASK
jgi:ribose transport system permease protein